MINKDYNLGVVGASQNKEKFGYKVFENLLNRGFKVIPVNPKGGELLGVEIRKDLFAIESKVDMVVFITPPEITLQILPLFDELSISKAWFQPGSENSEVIKFCQKNNISYTKDACIML